MVPSVKTFLVLLFAVLTANAADIRSPRASCRGPVLGEANIWHTELDRENVEFRIKYLRQQLQEYGSKEALKELSNQEYEALPPSAVEAGAMETESSKKLKERDSILLELAFLGGKIDPNELSGLVEPGILEVQNSLNVQILALSDSLFSGTENTTPLAAIISNFNILKGYLNTASVSSIPNQQSWSKIKIEQIAGIIVMASGKPLGTNDSYFAYYHWKQASLNQIVRKTFGDH